MVNLKNIKYIKVEYLDPWDNESMGGLGWQVDRKSIRSFRKRVEKMKNAFQSINPQLGIRKLKTRLIYINN